MLVARPVNAPPRIKRPLLACVWLLCIAFSAGQALAQAWPQPKGGAYVKVSHGRATASEQYRFDGRTLPYADEVDGDAFFDRSFYLYAEYGLTDRITLVTMLPYKGLTVRDGAFEYETSGVGSIMLGLRTGLKEAFGLHASSRHTFAANLAMSVPTGYTRNLSPPLGSGQVDMQATINYGVSLYPFPGYAQAGLGYRYRSPLYALSAATNCQEGRDIHCIVDTEPKYDDELLFSGEAGVSAGRWALFQVLAQGVWSNQKPDASTSFTARNPIPTRQRYLKTGAGVTVYPIAGLGLSIQSFLTPYGRNTIRSTDWFFGLEYVLR